MQKHTVILPSRRFLNAEESDLNIRIELKSEQKTLNQTDRTVVLNNSEQFNKERQTSNRYRLTGTLKPLWSNTSEVTTNNRQIFSEMFLDSQNIENIINTTGANTIEDITIDEAKGWISSDEFDFIRNDYEGSDDPNIFKPFGITTAHKQNWQVLLTYPTGKIKDKTLSVRDGYMVSKGMSSVSFNLQDGLPYVIDNTLGTLYTFYCPFGHNLNEGEYVLIGDVYLRVEKIGNTLEGFDNKIFTAYTTEIILTTGTFKRAINKLTQDDINLGRINNSISEYYIRKQKVIKTSNDIELQPNGFQSTIFEDEQKLPKYYLDANNPDFDLDFNGDGKIVTKENGRTYMWILSDYVDVTNLMDHNDNPVTELNLSIFFKNEMQFFQRQTTSYDNNTGYGEEDIHFIDASDLYDGTGNITKEFTYDDEIEGDIYEYNPHELKEYRIQKRVNRLVHNTDYFTSSTNDYFYYVHQPITLQVYSEYIEEGNKDEIYNIPKNAKYDKIRQKWRWRDIYDKGFIDQEGLGVDYPYRNGSHYIHTEQFFYIKPDTIPGVTDKLTEEQKQFLNDNC